MKKLMLCLILSILCFNIYSQDTSCTYFTGKRVIEFNYYTSTPIYELIQEEKFYEIDIAYCDVLCLDLSDKKKRFRKVIIIFSNGEKVEKFLKSEDNVYFSPRGAIKILVGRPTIFKI